MGIIWGLLLIADHAGFHKVSCVLLQRGPLEALEEDLLSQSETGMTAESRSMGSLQHLGSQYSWIEETVGRTDAGTRLIQSSGSHLLFDVPAESGDDTGRWKDGVWSFSNLVL